MTWAAERLPERDGPYDAESAGPVRCASCPLAERCAFG